MRSKGFTLAETLITVGLMFLLGMCVFLVILPSFRIAAEGQIRTELQQQGELALQQLNLDMQSSVPLGVSLVLPSGSQGMMVAANPLALTTGPTGALAYMPMAKIWWHDLNKKQLFRKTFHNGDPPGTTVAFQTNQAVRIQPPALLAICGAKGPDDRSYAMSVDTFTVEVEPTTGGEVYAMRMVLSKVIPGKNKSAVVELFRKVMLRNHS
ncbi:hypothetical protein JST97_21775 [bacterium]|nr:hypothetical protein [bacterium]